MASRTFLELVNDVLTELREPPVATWAANDYSRLIGRFVNAAKRDAEDAWSWVDLRHDPQVTTAAGTSLYTLPGTSERTVLLGAWNNSKRIELRQLTRYGSAVNRYASVTTTGPVQEFAVRPLSGGLVQVQVFPTPSEAETLVFECYTPPADFTTDNDTLVIPHRPVVDIALARAKIERGEDGGAPAELLTAIARQSLASAIAMDSERIPGSLVWVPV